MRILLITDNHTPTGGAEHCFFELKRQLQTQSDTSVYSIGFGLEAERGEDYQIFPALNTNIEKLLWRTCMHPLLYFKLRRAIKRFNPDIIHLHNIKQYPISLLKAVKGYTVIQTVHDFSPICPSGWNLHRNLQPCPTGLRRACVWEHQVKFKRLAYLALLPSWWRINRLIKKSVRTFISPSPLLTDYLQRNQFPHVQTIAPFHQEKQPRAFSNADAGHFLFAGHLGMHKGVELLLTEFALACQQNTTLLLTVAGTGPAADFMQQQVNTLGIHRHVRFVGWQAQLDTFYHKCMAVIFPSIGLESYGLVITEAMASARPVIGINRGTCAWLIEHEKSGLLFDPLQPGDLAQQILRLANNREEAELFGTHALAKAQRLLSNKQILKAHLDLYASVMGK